MSKYEVKSTGVSAYKGNDLGVYNIETGELIKGFNSLSNDYAYTVAYEYKHMLDKQNRKVL